MGCCSSCLRCLLRGGSSRSETEMTSGKSSSKGGSDDNTKSSRSLAMSRGMSAPTIQLERDETVSGTGLALAGVSIEQDAAYWEWHITLSPEINDKRQTAGEDQEHHEDAASAVKFGVATRKDAKFYKALKAHEDNEDATSSEDGTALMRPIPNLQDGDTVGVAVQHSDLPMIQFLLNGEPLHELAINRFRGAVYPAIYIPQEENGITARVVFDENDFREMSPHARFGPLIVARGII